MNCKELCINYKNKTGSKILGDRICYCRICGIQMEWSEPRCPCCKMRVRRRPRSKMRYAAQQERRQIVRI